MDFHTLFSEWKEKYPFQAFIQDGIVSPKHYEAPHVLFVLRDMNCSHENNLCKDLRTDGSGWRTWNNIGRWTKALLDGVEEYPIDMSMEKRVMQLKRVAVMNLKKEGGVSRTDGNQLLEAVETQREMIYDEICLCEPDIIICCGLPMKDCPSNADLLWQHVFPIRSEWEKFQSLKLPHEWWFYHASVNEKEVPVISFCHPQATNLCGCRGHEQLFVPLYQDMLQIRSKFLKKTLER